MVMGCIFTIVNIESVRCHTKEYDVRLIDWLDLGRGVVDLREVVDINTPECYRVDIELDSIHLWSPRERLDFCIAGDTVYQVGCETRTYNVNYTPFKVKLGSPRERFSFKGRIYQSEFICGDGISIISMPSTVVLITQEGDTVANAWRYTDCQRSRWSVVKDSISIRSGCSSINTAYIMIPGEEFPIAYSRHIKTEYSGGKIIHDSIAWIRHHLSSELANRKDSKYQKEQLNSQQSTNNFFETQVFCDNHDVTVAIVGNELKINFFDLDDEEVLMSVCDMLGRSYIENQSHVVNGEILIDVESLPRGELLLYLTIEKNAIPLVVKIYHP